MRQSEDTTLFAWDGGDEDDPNRFCLLASSPRCFDGHAHMAYMPSLIAHGQSDGDTHVSDLRSLPQMQYSTYICLTDRTQRWPDCRLSDVPPT